MYHEPDARDERFRRVEATAALRSAVDELAQRTGHTLEAMEQMSMDDIYRLAVESYGDHLPEFWSTWAEWHDAWGDGDMGEAPLN